jgi:LAS superfamily LD-carboxypeptidase LdcB
MLAAAEDAGFKMQIISTYRSFARSEQNFNRKKEELVASGMTEDEAVVEAAKWIAPPGQSEHNTGLASMWCRRNTGTNTATCSPNSNRTTPFNGCTKTVRITALPALPENKQDITILSMNVALPLCRQGKCPEDYERGHLSGGISGTGLGW